MAESDTITSLSVYTTLKFSSDLLKKITGLAYFYDVNWIANQNGFNASALPFAFVHIIKDTITQRSNVSTKRVILYEEGLKQQDAAKKARKGVLEVVADNIVNEPPTHSIEGLIPTTYLAKTLSGLSNTISDVVSVIGRSAGATAKELEGVTSTLASVSMCSDYVAKISNFVSQFMPSWSSTYNVDSLANMQSNSALIAYKTWQGFGKVKYGVIENLRIDKEGTEEDYFRVTLEFRELPVMTIGLKDLPNDVGKGNGIASSVMNGFVSVISGLLGGNL